MGPGSCQGEVRQGSPRSPGPRDGAVGLIFPLPPSLQGMVGLLDPETVLEVRGQTYYIIVYLISCVLEKKV